MIFTRRLQRKALRVFAWADRPAAWLLMVGGFITFVAVVFNLIATGSAKWATLLIAADLTVSGFSATQQAEQDEGDHIGPEDGRRLGWVEPDSGPETIVWGRPVCPDPVAVRPDPGRPSL